MHPTTQYSTLRVFEEMTEHDMNDDRQENWDGRSDTNSLHVREGNNVNVVLY